MRPAPSPPLARGDVLGPASATVLAAGAELTALVDRLVRREGGVTLTQYSVMGVLEGAGRAVEPREVAGTLGLGSGHLTEVLAGLERAGLAARERHGADGRRRLVTLTSEGARRLGWLRKLIAAAEERILDQALAPPEQEALVSLLGRLREAIARTPFPPVRDGP
jgi:DNA-binding MarR family transcriptional regulator